jgi:RNA polymerase sigma-70 factor (ECF subfamily)
MSRDKNVTEARRQHATAPEESPPLRALFEQHGAFVCRSLRLLGVRESDLDDVLQEVFLVVYQRLHDYEERGRARAWLYSICTRVARAQRRKLGRRREEVSVELPDAASAATQLEGLMKNEALTLGQELLQRLPREQRDVFWLYEIEELPMSEIAQALGCPLQTAYSRLHRARDRVMAEARRGASKETDHE